MVNEPGDECTSVNEARGTSRVSSVGGGSTRNAARVLNLPIMVKSYPAFLALFAAAASTVSASGQTRYAALKLFQDVGAPGDDSATSISRLVGFVNKHEANPLFTQVGGLAIVYRREHTP
jgi:hypothetical protein